MTTPRKDKTLGEASEAFLASIKVDGTRRAWSQALKPMTAHFGEASTLAGLTADAVSDWFSRQWREASPATWNMRVRGLRAAFAWWGRKHCISDEQAAELKSALETVKERSAMASEPLTPGEVQLLLKQTAAGLAPSRRSPTVIRNRAIIMLLYRSGLRVGEMLAIRPADIDMTACSIRLRETKSGHAQTRYFHESARDSLAHWLDRRAELGINGRQPVFCSLQGHPLADDYVRTMLRRHAASAGIVRRVHPHGLRHTFAVELEAAGVTVSEISRLLGHSSVAVTSRYLDHLTNRQAGQALADADLPDVGEGTSGQRDLAVEVTELRQRLAALEQPGNPGQ